MHSYVVPLLSNLGVITPSADRLFGGRLHFTAAPRHSRYYMEQRSAAMTQLVC